MKLFLATVLIICHFHAFSAAMVADDTLPKNYIGVELGGKSYLYTIEYGRRIFTEIKRVRFDINLGTSIGLIPNYNFAFPLMLHLSLQNDFMIKPEIGGGLSLLIFASQTHGGRSRNEFFLENPPGSAPYIINPTLQYQFLAGLRFDISKRSFLRLMYYRLYPYPYFTFNRFGENWGGIFYGYRF